MAKLPTAILIRKLSLADCINLVAKNRSKQSHREEV